MSFRLHKARQLLVALSTRSAPVLQTIEQLHVQNNSSGWLSMHSIRQQLPSAMSTAAMSRYTMSDPRRTKMSTSQPLLRRMANILRRASPYGRTCGGFDKGSKNLRKANRPSRVGRCRFQAQTMPCIRRGALPNHRRYFVIGVFLGRYMDPSTHVGCHDNTKYAPEYASIRIRL
jgi:hypothetical protein